MKHLHVLILLMSLCDVLRTYGVPVSRKGYLICDENDSTKLPAQKPDNLGSYTCVPSCLTGESLAASVDILLSCKSISPYVGSVCSIIKIATSHPFLCCPILLPERHELV
jgi:hypothetical protein